MLVEAMIAQMCTSFTTIDYQACSKAMEAASIQYHIKPEVDGFETAATRRVYNDVAGMTGEPPLIAVGVAAKTYRDRALKFQLTKSHGLIPAVSTEAKLSGGGVTFKWNF